VVTSLTKEQWEAQALYEKLYCGRGYMENRIKEQFSLFADRVSSEIRTKLLKIGAQIRVTVRKVWVSMASSYPWQDLYHQVWENLRC
jgi:hypothetical protein